MDPTRHNSIVSAATIKRDLGSTMQTEKGGADPGRFLSVERREFYRSHAAASRTMSADGGARSRVTPSHSPRSKMLNASQRITERGNNKFSIERRSAAVSSEKSELRKGIRKMQSIID